MYKSIAALFLIVVGASSTQADVLTNAIAQEMSLVSICPAYPTVAVIGASDIAGLFQTKLVGQGGVTVLERQQLGALTSEQCLQSSTAINPETAVDANNTLFAKFMILVESSPVDAVPFNAQIAVVQTNTQAVIATQEFSAGSFEQLDQQLDTIITEYISTIQGANYECEDRFDVILTADVLLACSGNVPELNTGYSIASTFSMSATANNVDLAERGQQQSVGGFLSVTEGSAETELQMSTTRTQGECTVTLDSTRNIDIQLNNESVPAAFAITVPGEGSAPWSVSYHYVAPSAFLSGNATMTNLMITSGAEACSSGPPEHTVVTPYRHYELEAVEFPSMSVRPNCTPVEVGDYLLKTPNFAVPNAHDTKSSCHTGSATVSASVQRRF